MFAELPLKYQEWASNRGGKGQPVTGLGNELGERPAYLAKKTRGEPLSLAERGLRNLRTPWSTHAEARLRSALKAIPAEDYPTWIRVGMALHHLEWERNDGTSIGFDIWDEWSATCPEKYACGALERAWQGLNRDSGRMVTDATIFHMAIERGWTGDDVPSSKAESRADSGIPPSNQQLTEGEAISPAAAPDGVFSAADLRRMTFDPLRYVLPPYIPEGLTLLVGRPKVGKSWWALDLCVACATGRTTLGKVKPVQGDVLYLALEDGKRRLQNRLDKLLSAFGGEWPSRLLLAPMGSWPRADQGGLARIEAWCNSVPNATLVVIDTLERIRKPVSGKGPTYAADYEAIAVLQKIATEFNIAIVVLHHDRKAEADDAFDTVSGTLGLTAAADTILIIKRQRNGTVLYARGRDIEESETAMQFDKDTCRWTILGLASEVHRSNERARVVAALKAAGQALTVREIMIEAEMTTRNATDILLGKMVRDGEIERVGKGRYSLSAHNTGKIGQTERNGS